MAGREVVKKTLQQVRPILSVDNAEARRRVLALYKAWYRQIPYVGELCFELSGVSAVCVLYHTDTETERIMASQNKVAESLLFKHISCIL